MKLFSIIFASALCTSCDSGVLWEDHPYEVHWIDIGSNRTLAYSLGNGGSIGRVEPEVIAVGSNDSYVVAKQRSKTTKIVSYFYIDREKDDKYYNRDKITKGPFNQKEFTEISNLLNLPNFSESFE